jgi:hypothetical protein
VTVARFLQAVLANPEPGREDEFNQWYDNEHLPDLLTVPGVVAAQRFRYVGSLFSEGSAHAYLTLYEVEADSLEDAQNTLKAALGEPGRVRSSSSLRRDFAQWYFEPLAERVTADG